MKPFYTVDRAGTNVSRRRKTDPGSDNANAGESHDSSDTEIETDACGLTGAVDPESLRSLLNPGNGFLGLGSRRPVIEVLRARIVLETNSVESDPLERLKAST